MRMIMIMMMMMMRKINSPNSGYLNYFLKNSLPTMTYDRLAWENSRHAFRDATVDFPMGISRGNQWRSRETSPIFSG